MATTATDIATNNKDDNLKIYCILIQTGSSKGSNGALQVYIKTSSNTEGYFPAYMPGNIHGHEYNINEVVLDTCYTNFVNLQISNPSSNGWKGIVLLSMDLKESYVPFECNDCDNGDESDETKLTEILISDADDYKGDKSGAALCLFGKTCTLTEVS